MRDAKVDADIDRTIAGKNKSKLSQTQVVGGGGVFITKLYNRTCRDNNNNRYTYTINDDSTVSYLQLTAI